MITTSDKLTSRREFLKTSAVLSGALAVPAILTGNAFAAGSNDTLRVGLVGCGGRGSGAAGQALRADPNAVLVAMGDAFEERLQNSLRVLSEPPRNKKSAPGDQAPSIADQVKVTPDKCFAGLDAYQKVIDSGVDVVLLASPPGFRPLHLQAAVAAGKHIFCEKPMATDVPGLRSVMESAKAAKAKNLALVAGFCWRYDPARREFYKRILDGAIGEVRGVHATYLTSPVKPMPAASTRPANMSDVKWQVANWYNFTWLSGDGLVEQACHSVDKILWAMKDVPPLRCTAGGGRVIPNNEGNIFDHIDVFYEWESGVRASMAQRQISQCHSENSDYITGATGTGVITRGAVALRGATPWRHTGEKKDMYQVEHDELFASIRSGKPINDGDRMAQSTLAALMGRMAAYTGQEITWEMALNSQEKLVPDNLTWDMKLPITPMAVPGKTKFI